MSNRRAIARHMLETRARQFGYYEFACFIQDWAEKASGWESGKLKQWLAKAESGRREVLQRETRDLFRITEQNEALAQIIFAP